MLTFLLTRIVGTILVIALSGACSPTLPPTTVPAQPNPTFEPFKAALQAYVDQTQPFRKQAAEEAEKVPGKAAVDIGAEQSVRTRQSVLADALRTTLRPNATQGDLITPAMAEAIRRDIAAIFTSPKRDLLIDELAEQTSTPPSASTPAINEPLDAPRVPPRLMEVLPPLPKQLEYDFLGRTLVLLDVDADVVVDYLPDALPEQAPAAAPVAPATPWPPGATSPLPMPRSAAARSSR